MAAIINSIYNEMDEESLYESSRYSIMDEDFVACWDEEVWSTINDDTFIKGFRNRANVVADDITHQLKSLFWNNFSVDEVCRAVFDNNDNECDFISPIFGSCNNFNDIHSNRSLVKTVPKAMGINKYAPVLINQEQCSQIENAIRNFTKECDIEGCTDWKGIEKIIQNVKKGIYGTTTISEHVPKDMYPKDTDWRLGTKINCDPTSISDVFNIKELLNRNRLDKSYRDLETRDTDWRETAGNKITQMGLDSDWSLTHSMDSGILDNSQNPFHKSLRCLTYKENIVHGSIRDPRLRGNTHIVKHDPLVVEARPVKQWKTTLQSDINSSITANSRDTQDNFKPVETIDKSAKSGVVEIHSVLNEVQGIYDDTSGNFRLFSKSTKFNISTPGSDSNEGTLYKMPIIQESKETNNTKSDNSPQNFVRKNNKNSYLELRNEPSLSENDAVEESRLELDYLPPTSKFIYHKQGKGVNDLYQKKSNPDEDSTISNKKLQVKESLELVGPDSFDISFGINDGTKYRSNLSSDSSLRNYVPEGSIETESISSNSSNTTLEIKNLLDESTCKNIEVKDQEKYDFEVASLDKNLELNDKTNEKNGNLNLREILSAEKNSNYLIPLSKELSNIPLGEEININKNNINNLKGHGTPSDGLLCLPPRSGEKKFVNRDEHLLDNLKKMNGKVAESDNLLSLPSRDQQENKMKNQDKQFLNYLKKTENNETFLKEGTKVTANQRDDNVQLKSDYMAVNSSKNKIGGEDPNIKEKRSALELNTKTVCTVKTPKQLFSNEDWADNNVHISTTVEKKLVMLESSESVFLGECNFPAHLSKSQMKTLEKPNENSSSLGKGGLSFDVELQQQKDEIDISGFTRNIEQAFKRRKVFTKIVNEMLGRNVSDKSNTSFQNRVVNSDINSKLRESQELKHLRPQHFDCRQLWERRLPEVSKGDIKTSSLVASSKSLDFSQNHGFFKKEKKNSASISFIKPIQEKDKIKDKFIKSSTNINLETEIAEKKSCNTVKQQEESKKKLDKREKKKLLKKKKKLMKILEKYTIEDGEILPSLEDIEKMVEREEKEKGKKKEEILSNIPIIIRKESTNKYDRKKYLKEEKIDRSKKKRSFHSISNVTEKINSFLPVKVPDPPIIGPLPDILSAQKRGKEKQKHKKLVHKQTLSDSQKSIEKHCPMKRDAASKNTILNREERKKHQFIKNKSLIDPIKVSDSDSLSIESLEGAEVQLESVAEDSLLNMIWRESPSPPRKRKMDVNVLPKGLKSAPNKRSWETSDDEFKIKDSLDWHSSSQSPPHLSENRRSSSQAKSHDWPTNPRKFSPREKRKSYSPTLSRSSGRSHSPTPPSTKTKFNKRSKQHSGSTLKRKKPWSPPKETLPVKPFPWEIEGISTTSTAASYTPSAEINSYPTFPIVNSLQSHLARSEASQIYSQPQYSNLNYHPYY